ncbi:hypothetical protein FRC11_003297 [Ceratobasidium sp. 423]|nr:hypothetical protein FRC11_003297 [Ceratobasidium sp. 423]
MDLSLLPGRYHAQFIDESDRDSPPIGGMYATAKGLQAPVILAHQTEELEELQTEELKELQWMIFPRPEGEGNAVTIQSIRYSEIPEFWNYERSRGKGGGDTITLGEPTPFVVERVRETNDNSTYTIRLADQLIGATFYVGANLENNTVVIRVIPVILGAPPVPIWQLRRLGN